MALLIALVLAAAAVLAALAVSRVLRVQRGLEPQPDSLRLAAIAVVALVVPPILIQTVVVPAKSVGQASAIEAVLLFFLLVVAFWVVMRIAGRLVGRFAPAANRPVLLLALTGRETQVDIPFDAAMTGSLLERVAAVDSLNSAFPRGREFLDQVERPGFHTAWDALNVATVSLETRITEAGQLHLGVAQATSDTATDARARLDVLRNDAAGRGQIWAV